MRKITTLFFAGLALAGPAFGHGMSEADKIRAAGGGIAEFLRQGAVHMVTGYDHLLFLFGVVFFLSKFKDILKFVTAFTLGHCITLIGATFLGIQANYFLVDALIALTVCYKGFDNVGGFEKYFGRKSPNLLAMVFVFGLIHGFGLSTRLQTLTIGEGWDLLGKILAFNVGVEAGQVFALVIILAALAGWRRTESFQRFSKAANAGLIIVGGLLLLMQLHGFQHQDDPMDVGNLAKHLDAHEDLGVSDGEILPAGYHVDPGNPTPHKAHGTPTAALPADLHVDPGNPIPHKAHGTPTAAIPAGLHVDPGNPIPHKAHGTPTAALPAGLHVDPGNPTPHEAHGTPATTLPPGLHVDPGNPTPHKAHGIPAAAIPPGLHVDPGNPTPHKAHTHTSSTK